MKPALFLIAIALVPAGAQTPAMKQPAPAVARATGTVMNSEKPPVPLPTMGALEKEMDGRISSTGGADPCIVVGGARGVYVNGFGVIFTSDVDLINSPGGQAIFGSATVGAPQKMDTHKRKLAHVAPLQQTMRDMVLSLSGSPSLKLTDTDHVVVAVRLMYRPWEDTTGLPGQIIVRLEHRGAMVITEVQ